MAVGKAAINSIDLAINQDLKAILPKEAVDRDFLLHFLLSKAKYLEGRAQGATVKGIKLELLRSLEFPQLSIEEQRRIANVLDKASGVRRKRERLIRETQDFVRSAYLHTVGHLNPSHGDWEPFTIEALAEDRRGAIRSGPFGSALRHGEFVDEGIAVLGIDNAVQNKFAWAERRFITPSKYEELRRYKVLPGDVIITIMGTTGRSAVVPDDIPEAITTKHLATITSNKELIHPEVLSFAIHSDPLIIRQIKSFNKGAIMDGLNLGIIRKLEINLPPMEEQLRFVRMLRKARAIETRSQTSVGSGEDLFQSLSQRAFRGEL
jgi:type I restriction enzyme S subunit